MYVCHAPHVKNPGTSVDHLKLSFTKLPVKDSSDRIDRFTRFVTILDMWLKYRSPRGA